jgi:hypothetical protein
MLEDDAKAYGADMQEEFAASRRVVLRSAVRSKRKDIQHAYSACPDNGIMQFESASVAAIEVPLNMSINTEVYARAMLAIR